MNPVYHKLYSKEHPHFLPECLLCYCTWFGTIINYNNQLLAGLYYAVPLANLGLNAPIRWKALNLVRKISLLLIELLHLVQRFIAQGNRFTLLLIGPNNRNSPRYNKKHQDTGDPRWVKPCFFVANKGVSHNKKDRITIFTFSIVLLYYTIWIFSRVSTRRKSNGFGESFQYSWSFRWLSCIQGLRNFNYFKQLILQEILFFTDTPIVFSSF